MKYLLHLLFVATLLAGPGLARAAALTTDIELSVLLDPAERRLEGRADLRLPAAAHRHLLLSDGAGEVALSIDGKPATTRPRKRHGRLSWSIPAGAKSVGIAWRMTLAATPTALDHRDTLQAGAATAAELGSFLPAAAGWYPTVAVGREETLQRWRVTIDVPQGQHAIVPGRLVEHDDSGGRARTTYRMDVPAEGIDLMAGPYRVAERSIKSADGRSLRLRTLFHPEIEALSGDYLDALAGYFTLYEQWIGPYPFDDFTIVSSPTPTGFGMPSLTYLGIEVLKLPFIRHTSLGHEVLHNWWGNGIYPDYAHGNWAEGLTTFMADYTYAERDSDDKAREMRLGWLRDLSAIPPGKGMPLARFTARRHGVDAAIGYGKAAMVFYMLRERIGREAFDRAIRRFWRSHRFKVAGWSDLRAAFEAEAGQPLQTFFEQWIDREGLPSVTLSADAEAAAVQLSQGKPVYALTVPLQLQLGETKQALSVALNGEHAVVDAANGPGTLRLDPDFRLLRRLLPAEIPPTLRDINLTGGRNVVLLGEGPVLQAGLELAAALLDAKPEVRDAANPPDKSAPLLLIGPADEVDGWLARHSLAGRPDEVGRRGQVQVWAGRLAGARPLLVVSATSATALASARRSLPHLGRYGWVTLEDGRSAERGQWKARTQSLQLPAPAKPRD